MKTAILVASCCGLVLGLVMVSPFFGTFMESWLNDHSSVVLAWNIVNFPATAAASVWSYVLRLPPGGEWGAWVVVPVVFIFLQWVLVGIGVGFIAGCLRR